MKNNFLAVMVGIVLSIIGLASCSDNNSDLTPNRLELDITGNKPDLFKLGRVLFYDTHLSVNGAIACASCHKQSIAFSDQAAFSPGFENQMTVRNSMPIQNLFLSSELFWDGRETILNSMVLKPIFNHVEMGMSNDILLVQRVKNVSYYDDLFKKAFMSSGNDLITINNISTALTEFVRGISSNQSLFDRYNRNEALLPAFALTGKYLFFSKYNCNRCHDIMNPVGYNHGSDSKISQVLDHYSNTIVDHPNLDKRLRDTNGHPIKMDITDQDKAALLAFLNTLTDYSMITDPDLSNPFKVK
jgi:cytochrome c peroxidase